MKIKGFIVALLLLFTLCSCLNRYEAEFVGQYQLYKYEVTDPEIVVDRFSKLDIRKDKTFQLQYDTATISGKWEADDYGDWTLIELETGGTKTKGQMSINGIVFEFSGIFNFDHFKKMEFVRLNDTIQNSK